MTIAAPGALWLLGLIPLVWIVLRFGRTNFNRRQQIVQAAVRSCVVGLLVLGLSRPVVSTGTSRLSIVYLVDVSHSIATRAIVDAAAQIDAWNTAVRPDFSRVVVFGRSATLVRDTAALRTLAASDLEQDTGDVRREGSDLELALAEARAELQPGAVPRIVLFTDGRETGGDVHAAMTRLAADGVPVHTVPLAVRDIGDAWIEAVSPAPRISAGTFARISVAVGSQRPVSGATVSIAEGDRVLATSELALAVGTTTAELDVRFETDGPHVIHASVAMRGDTLTANNQLSHEVLVEPRVRVLYVEGTPASARYLRNALTGAGYDVTVRPVSDLPSRAEDLAAFDVVILSDLARATIPDRSMTTLARWVETQGGGLLVTGGEAVFGDGKPGGPPGYRHSELERLTPVTFERKDEPQVALVMVLDRSFSMAGRVMDLCKAAARAALDVLTDEQMLGVISFNDEWHWDVTPANVGQNRPAMERAIASIDAEGRTLIYPAVEQAYLALRKVNAGAKHVILLSDGRSYPDDYEGLVKKMVDAKMTVSSVAVGLSADAELLTNIAKWGRGRNYTVRDAEEVAQIFVKEAKDASAPAFIEGEGIKPIVKAKSFLSRVDLTRMPALKGRTALVIKDGATELLATERGDPILAFWPIGLGRTAVFAGDVKDRWADAWLRWPQYGPFFAAVVRELARQRTPALTLHVAPGIVHGDKRALSVAIEARNAAGDYQDMLKPVISVRAANGRTVELAARQVAPGRYEAAVIADASQPLTVGVVAPASASPLTRHVVPDPAAEYRLRPADVGLLRSIAHATGGTFSPTPTDLGNATGLERTSRRALWPWLIAAALLLWIVDIVLRRIRLFERTATGD